MEEALLPERGDWKSVRRWGAFVEELKKLSYMAAPMAAVTVSQYFLQVVPVMVAGHLGELSLSGVAIATSFTNVTGFSILVGLAGALETLCGQAYGAEQYQKLGTFTYSAMISLIPICLLVSLLWTFMGKLLIFLGQDLEVSMVACRYAIWLLPALFAYAILQPLIRYFQSQCLILPLLVSSFATLSFHIPLCWALVFKFGLGTTGAALSVGISYWLNVIFLLFHLRYSPSCEKTNLLISKDIFLSIKLFFRYGLPSAVMVCLEWWSFELLILLSGLLPNSKLETSVLSICLTTTSLHYVIPYGISAAGSTRVSNELGAGNPRAARVAVCALVVLTAAEATIMATALFSCRYVFGYAYSSDKEVIDYVMEVTPLLCLSIILDSLHAVLSGVARGSGWQHIGAYVNLAAYYVVGVPVGIVLCFVLHYRGKGLWCGIVIGSAIQATSLALITVFTNWNEQAVKARKRIFEGTSLPSTGLV